MTFLYYSKLKTELVTCLHLEMFSKQINTLSPSNSILIAPKY